MKPDNVEEIEALLDILPRRLFSNNPDLKDFIEIILDLGKAPEVRFANGSFTLLDVTPVTRDDIEFITTAVGSFTSDNRAGIERTLHRISAIRNRHGSIVGLTLRVGRAIYGTIDIMRDVVESGKNILFLGPPGIGKTTKLRESARVLSEELNKRVIVVDTSNEIAGDGDIPHPGIGRSRRMQVQSPDKQHAVMIEAVENHMPQVIIVDEIGTEAEAQACRTIAERGVQLIATAHGTALENLMSNPTLSDLIGGIQTVILGDEEAKKRGSQKAVLERKAPPTFDILIEIRERDMLAVYLDVAKAVDISLRGRVPRPEIRVRDEKGRINIEKVEEEMVEPTDSEIEEATLEKDRKLTRIYPFGVNRADIERGVKALGLPATTVGKLDEADIILTVKSKAKSSDKIISLAEEHAIPVHVIKKNVSSQVMKFLEFFFRGGQQESEAEALLEVEDAIEQVLKKKKTVEVSPQNSYVRRLQHQKVKEAGLKAESFGDEPKRRLRIYPQ